MPYPEDFQLISDTLHYRPSRQGTCFVVNEPGLKLLSADANLLPAIKKALQELSSEENFEKLYGLSYVIGAFLIIGTKYAPETLVPFILSLPLRFQKQIVSVLPTFFRKDSKTGMYNFSVGPTIEVLELISRFSVSQDPDMQKIARRVIARISN
jgi:hypothetical protein